MYTCRTCKLLKHSKAKRKVIVIDGKLVEYKCEAKCAIDILADWYCSYFWSSDKPPKGQGCAHWQNMNGKHWI